MPAPNTFFTKQKGGPRSSLLQPVRNCAMSARSRLGRARRSHAPSPPVFVGENPTRSSDYGQSQPFVKLNATATLPVFVPGPGTVLLKIESVRLAAPQKLCAKRD